MVFDALPIQELDVLTYSNILVDDRSPDNGVASNAYMRPSGLEIVADVGEGLKEIRSHNDRVLDIDPVINAASQADDGFADSNSIENTTLAKHRIINITTMQL